MEFKVRKRKWNAIGNLTPLKGRIRISESDREEFEKELWNDLTSEFDSLNFYRHAHSCGMKLSKEFGEFLEAWRADERKHAEGFLFLYQECFGADPELVLNQLESRPADFSRLAWFFEDEFRLCLLIAYDELATTISYHLDRSFYRQIGGSELEAWIAGVKADEAVHLANLLNLMKLRFRDRFHEARAILEKVIEIDLNQENYDGTFVLDHMGSPFNPAMLKDCANRIINKLEVAV